LFNQEKSLFSPKNLALFVTIFTLISCLINPLTAQDRNLFTFDSSPTKNRSQTGNDLVSFKHIPEDVGRNLYGLFTNENLMLFTMGAGLTGLAIMLDENEFDDPDDQISHLHETGEESSLGRLGERMGNHIILPSVIASLAITGQIANNRRFKYFSYSLAQGYIVNNLLTISLKEVVSRTRPNQRNDLSFPSGHTSNAFTWATIFSHYYGRKAAIPAYGVATFIAWSRINVDAHYLSDVVFGAALGYIIGRTVVNTTDTRAGEKRFEWHPAASLSKTGVVASYRW
jgi:hypothetical protein